MNWHFMKHKTLTSDRLLRLNSPQIPPWPNSLIGGRTERYCKNKDRLAFTISVFFKVQTQVMLLFSVKREELSRFWHFTRRWWTSLEVWCVWDECLLFMACVSGKATVYSSSNALHNLGVETTKHRQNACHRKISSNGLVSRKQPSHTSLTAFMACSSSLHCGLARTDKAALLLTQS
jgi:hypothetical protein